jgi:hypothetical protein
MDSPAYRAGFVPQKDWIIGSPDIAINGADDFYNLMIHNQKRPVRLLVFNIDQEVVRETNVIPDFEWGGEGCLGCDVASGALHRIPLPTNGTAGVPLSVASPEAGASESAPSNYQNAVLVAPTGPHPTSVAPAKTFESANLQPIPGFEDTDPSQEVSFLQ